MRRVVTMETRATRENDTGGTMATDADLTRMKKKTPKLNLNIGHEAHRRLRIEAAQADMTMTQVVVTALGAFSDLDDKEKDLAFLKYLINIEDAWNKPE
jgi:hypothetical protein